MNQRDKRIAEIIASSFILIIVLSILLVSAYVFDNILKRESKYDNPRFEMTNHTEIVYSFWSKQYYLIPMCEDYVYYRSTLTKERYNELCEIKTGLELFN